MNGVYPLSKAAAAVDDRLVTDEHRHHPELGFRPGRAGERQYDHGARSLAGPSKNAAPRVAGNKYSVCRGSHCKLELWTCRFLRTRADSRATWLSRASGAGAAS